MGCYMLETSYNMINLRKFWQKGEPCPVAIWVGHHPAIEIERSPSLDIQKAISIAGGALGQAPSTGAVRHTW